MCCHRYRCCRRRQRRLPLGFSFIARQQQKKLCFRLITHCIGTFCALLHCCHYAILEISTLSLTLFSYFHFFLFFFFHQTSSLHSCTTINYDWKLITVRCICNVYAFYLTAKAVWMTERTRSPSPEFNVLQFYVQFSCVFFFNVKFICLFKHMFFSFFSIMFNVHVHVHVHL